MWSPKIAGNVTSAWRHSLRSKRENIWKTLFTEKSDEIGLTQTLKAEGRRDKEKGKMKKKI
jgi:hypothetical protein